MNGNLRLMVRPGRERPAGAALEVPAPARGSAAPASRAGAAYAEMDAYVARQMRRLRIPGAALAVVEGDLAPRLRGFGRARPGGAAPGPQTPFFLGSITKSITALAVMQLVEAGKVDLDAPVQRYLPWFRVADPGASAQMTVRHLLNQTSGLTMLSGWIPLADLDQRPDASERQARALAGLALHGPPGAAFEYSNMNYNLLGLIIAAAACEPYEAYVQRQIFAPLDMRHTYTTRAEASAHGLAVGHRYWFAQPVAVRAAADAPGPRGSLAAGQLISCAEDMAHYLIAHLNAGRYRDVRILSPVGMAALHRPAVPAGAMGVTVGQYAMGWFVEEPAARGPARLLWHTGVEPDFFAYMALLPEQNKAALLLINADHFLMTLPLTEMGLGVTRLLAGARPAPSRLGAIIPWALRGLLLIPALQILDVAATLRRARDGRRPGGRGWRRDLLAPLVPQGLLALALLPLRWPIGGFLRLFLPDGAWIAAVCGRFAVVWPLVRTALVLWSARRAPGAPAPDRALRRARQRA